MLGDLDGAFGAMGQEALQHDVSAGSELRVEVPNGKSVEITLVEGTAEVFGTEVRLASPATNVSFFNCF